MLKYTTTQIVFREIPDEITLAINISGCPIHCPDCHSKELWKDKGKDLSQRTLMRLIEENEGITCVAFMGGDSDPSIIKMLAIVAVNNFPDLKIAWYSGRDSLPDNFGVYLFDYIKLGPYKKEYGPLNNPNTNQRMYKYTGEEVNDLVFGFKDITYKFWNKES